eukprot:44558_1
MSKQASKSSSADSDVCPKKRETRLMKNRQAAHESRKRRKQYIQALEARVHDMLTVNRELLAENKHLRDCLTRVGGHHAASNRRVQFAIQHRIQDSAASGDAIPLPIPDPVESLKRLVYEVAEDDEVRPAKRTRRSRARKVREIENDDSNETCSDPLIDTDQMHSVGSKLSGSTQTSPKTRHSRMNPEAAKSRASSLCRELSDTMDVTMHGMDISETMQHSSGVSEVTQSSATSRNMQSRGFSETIQSRGFSETLHPRNVSDTCHNRGMSVSIPVSDNTRPNPESTKYSAFSEPMQSRSISYRRSKILSDTMQSKCRVSDNMQSDYHVSDIMQSRYNVSDDTQSRLDVSDTMQPTHHPFATTQSRHYASDVTQSTHNVSDALQSRRHIFDTVQSQQQAADTVQSRRHISDTVNSRHNVIDTMQPRQHDILSTTTQSRHQASATTQSRRRIPFTSGISAILKSAEQYSRRDFQAVSGNNSDISDSPVRPQKHIRSQSMALSRLKMAADMQSHAVSRSITSQQLSETMKNEKVMGVLPSQPLSGVVISHGQNGPVVSKLKPGTFIPRNPQSGPAASIPGPSEPQYRCIGHVVTQMEPPPGMEYVLFAPPAGRGVQRAGSFRRVTRSQTKRSTTNSEVE